MGRCFMATRSLTITEGLAEIKTINKRLETKRQFVAQHLMRQAQFKDPLEKESGSPAVLEQEIQAIRDLEESIVAIRLAIQTSNRSTNLKIGKTTHSVAAWLTWRKEIAPQQKAFYGGLVSAIETTRARAAQANSRMVSSEKEAEPKDVIVHIPEKKLSEIRESLETILGTLDGQLSLLNATTVISIPQSE